MYRHYTTLYVRIVIAQFTEKLVEATLHDKHTLELSKVSSSFSFAKLTDGKVINIDLTTFDQNGCFSI